MKITCDPAKREKTLVERGLDFLRAPEIFVGEQYTRLDERRDYGEQRFVTIGVLDGRMVVLVWTPREHARHVISLRKANEREQTRYRVYLD
ncbi:MAG: BrnT family toxin [Magnetococcales bacterium]|nr:BrnT family toxin [Magnetococcales bacterium]MBF0271819.1 BrnT family toxin [Magnetococcales bacterium]